MENSKGLFEAGAIELRASNLGEACPERKHTARPSQSPLPFQLANRAPLKRILRERPAHSCLRLQNHASRKRVSRALPIHHFRRLPTRAPQRRISSAHPAHPCRKLTTSRTGTGPGKDHAAGSLRQTDTTQCRRGLKMERVS